MMARSVEVKIFISSLRGPAGHLLGAASRRFMLFDWVIEGGFAEVRLGERAPNLDLRYVRDVIRDYYRFLDLLTFCHQTIQEISLAVGVHDLPMRVGRLWWDEVIGERERALTVLRSVRDEALVGFCALERATLVAVLGKAACCSHDQRG